MTVAAQVRGIAALVTSGSVRDRDAIAALDACEVFGFAVHARHGAEHGARTHRNPTPTCPAGTALRLRLAIDAFLLRLSAGHARQVRGSPALHRLEPRR